MSAVVIPVILRIIPVMPWSQWRSPGRHVRFGSKADITPSNAWDQTMFGTSRRQSDRGSIAAPKIPASRCA